MGGFGVGVCGFVGFGYGLVKRLLFGDGGGVGVGGVGVGGGS